MCSDPTDRLTFLARHFDGDSIAECSFAFASCVHLVLNAAVHHSKLDLWCGGEEKEGMDTETNVLVV